ncbi:class 1b ribonucleoside-diphosphate reductase subunit alpha [Mechercharimyces sp. CAU 1602]|uniref:class 1b ribonucleoside-diphosphate reductase subunit alpha n=1 Tax=Mechercharimyces sp. CAU 1602 TaxID=2973933 RepID=UPI002163ACE3|nr:class 1b ribonucleoside-diphosphate reductase subunit alpha [Mechercharimyces sp. CAU 1602]MCS1350923.1 class 1b ribonucleoside-diphosphate reductase subunit alpha [Mechercharimyces sp. CAU 1602]
MKHIELNNEVTKTVDGFYQLHKDREAIAKFEEEVAEKLIRFNSVIEQFHYMVEQDYYDPRLVEQYSLEEIESVYELAYAQGFTFESYMAITKFYTDYALKTNDKKQYLETYEDRVVAVSLYLAQGDVEKAKSFVIAMMNQWYQPATPTFLNAGKSRRGEMVSCFLLGMDDTLNSIMFNINTAAQLSKNGGGIAINLSRLRARREPIKGIEGAASGVMPVLKLLEDVFSYVDQLGQRRGAGAAYLNCFHWDVNEFLDSKKINADEKIRIASLSIGLIVPDKLFQLAKENQPMYVFAPYSVYSAYGEHLDDIDLDERYDELVANPQVEKRMLMSARDFLSKVATIQLESGYPYIMYKSNANRAHALRDIGEVKMSNLCTEIFQLMETSEINDYDQEDVIKRDINCNLGSLNIVNVMEANKIREAVHTGMEALTAVSDMTAIKNAPTVRKANREMHSVGLGAMNLHGYLAKNRIMFESEEARDFVRTFFMVVNFHSIEKSMWIARDRGETFKDFDRSDYANGRYFSKYVNVDFSPRTEQVKELFAGMAIPTQEDWRLLMEQVQQHGLYHAYRLAIAPTGSISYLQNATSSIMPITSAIESRTYANATTYYPMPFLAKENFWYYKSAYDMDMMKVIDLVAEAQEHIDQGISAILFVNSDISTRQLARYYVYANHKGLKSLYYTRSRKLDVEECLSCSV